MEKDKVIKMYPYIVTLRVEESGIKGDKKKIESWKRREKRGKYTHDI
jgi:hypothetical protein